AGDALPAERHGPLLRGDRTPYLTCTTRGKAGRSRGAFARADAGVQHTALPADATRRGGAPLRSGPAHVRRATLTERRERDGPPAATPRPATPGPHGALGHRRC